MMGFIVFRRLTFRSLTAGAIVLWLAVGFAEGAGAYQLRTGDILISNEDGANWITRIDPVSGFRWETGPFGIADSPTGLVVDLVASKIYMSDNDGNVVKQNITTGVQSYTSNYFGSLPVGSGASLSPGVAAALVELDGTLIVGGGSRITSVDPGTGDRVELIDLGIGTSIGGITRLSNGDYLVADPGLDRLWRFVPGTGIATNVSSGRAGSVVGSGPGFTRPQCVIEYTPNRVYLVDLVEVFEVDLATGDRTILSDATTGTGPIFEHLECLVQTGAGLFVTDWDSNCNEAAVMSVDPVTGNRAIVSSVSPPVGNGPNLCLLGPIVEDTDGSLLVGTLGVIRVDPVTGDRTVVMNSDVGEDSDWFNPNALALEADGSLIADHSDYGYGLLRIDPGTGDWVVVTHDSTLLPIGAGPDLTNGELLLEADGNLIHVGGQSVVRVDVSSGDRTILSDGTHGSGLPFTTLYASAWGPGSNVYVVDFDFPDARIIAVHLVTGDRTEVSGPSLGSGPLVNWPVGLALEPSGTLIVAEPLRILRVDPVTGNRSLVSGDGVGAGPAFGYVSDVDIEAFGEIVVSDWDFGVFRVHPETGDRTLVSGYTPETGLVGGGSGSIESPWAIAVVPGRPQTLPAMDAWARSVLLGCLGVAALTALRSSRRKQTGF
jgi:hypothetical protein